MKNIIKTVFAIIILMLALTGCAGKNNLKSQLTEAWYLEDSQEIAFVLYDDDTCEIAGEYGTGVWSIVNGNQLKISNFYGEAKIATIVNIENGCLILEIDNEQIKFWDNPQTKNIQTSETVNQNETEYDKDSNLVSLYQIKNYDLGEFIDGVAYIKYKINGEYQGALINCNGTIIARLDGEEFSGKRDKTTGACYSEKNVVDVEGNVIFTVKDGQKIMCVGDKMILIYEEAMGFENAEARIGVVSFDGEWIYPMTSDNLMIDDEKIGLRDCYCCRYAGEGCFVVDNDYNTSLGLSKYETVIFDVYNKTSSIYNGKLITGFDHGVALDKGQTIFIDHFGNVIKETEDFYNALGDGLYYCNNERILYNYSGEVIKNLNEYNKAVVTYFNNGYGYFESKGADENRYFSIIDSNGEFLFNPIMKERTYSNQPNGFYGDFYNGEFITDQKSFDISGNLIYDFRKEITSCREGIVIVENKYMTTHGQLIEPMVPEK